METPRITTEQLVTDNNFINELQTKREDWKKELVWLEKELVEQALIDAKQGTKSNRYLFLESRERDVKRYLKDAEEKLGLVAKRYDNALAPLRDLINLSLNRVRP